MYYIRRKRLFYILLCFILISILLPVHLYNIQIARGRELYLQAMEQDTEKAVLEDIMRGQILDRNLNSLTGGGQSYRIIVFPNLITEKQFVIDDLSKMLGINQKELDYYFNGKPCFLPYNLSPGQVQKVKDYRHKGITLQAVNFYYGEHPLANHLIGHLGKIPSEEYLQQLNSNGDNIYYISDLVGKMGLEKYYDNILKDRYPQRSIRLPRDANGNLIKGSQLIYCDNPDTNDRSDLVLTIDRDIQKTVEQVMDRRVKKGAVVVMDVATGDILAMSSRPDFDPRHVEAYLSCSENAFLNRATALFQPGSVFKVAVAAAALEEKLVDDKTFFTCEGKHDKLVSCWNIAGHGRINFLQAFSQSCNPAFAETGLKLGAENIIHYTRLLGLDNQEITGYKVVRDQRQNLDLIAEKNNLVNSSIGQGPVLATPVQITAMLNTIATKGIYKKPVIVKEIRRNGKTVKYIDSEQGKRVLSEVTARILQDYLKSVITEGVGKEAYIPLYGSAGKTGSAQTGNQGKVNAWFSGFAPLENPRYTITVLVEDSTSGGESAAPVFKEIIEKLL